MDKQIKLKQALQLSEAMKNKSEAFVLMEKLDRLEEQIENIKQQEVKDEETQIILDII